MTRSFWVWPAIAVLLTIAVGLLAFGDVDTSVRPVLTLGFLALCPGLAFVRLLRIKEWWMEWTLAVALSVALETLVATASLYGGFWSPNGVLAIVLCLTMVGLLLEFAASFRIVPRRATAPGP